MRPGEFYVSFLFPFSRNRHIIDNFPLNGENDRIVLKLQNFIIIIEW